MNGLHIENMKKEFYNFKLGPIDLDMDAERARSLTACQVQRAFRVNVNGKRVKPDMKLMAAQTAAVR